jgi:hypothetical protein
MNKNIFTVADLQKKWQKGVARPAKHKASQAKEKNKVHTLANFKTDNTENEPKRARRKNIPVDSFERGP